MASTCQILLFVVVSVTVVTRVESCLGGGPPPEPKDPVSFTCGNDDLNHRIIGGSEADQHSIPWQAALVSHWSGGKPFCGGAIISPYHILTAAHCAWVPNIWVRVGEHDITTHQDDSTLHKVQCITSHPTYNPRDKPMDNDFAVLTLEDPLDLVGMTSVIRAICLPPDNPPPTFEVDQTMFTVSGWGLLEEGGEDQPQVLHHVQVPYYNRSVCETAYAEELEFPNIITENMMCAGHADGGIDSCQGDSGGPMTLNIDDTEYVMGVVSWGVGCGRPELPGVYAKVSAQLDWIRSLGINGNQGQNLCPACSGILCIFG